MSSVTIPRARIPYETQAHVYFRDRWLCSQCARPTIFPLALKQLAQAVGSDFPGLPLAYWNPQWRRDAAPLLDELAASVDHVHAHSKGGAHDESNFATICARCNARKGSRSTEEHLIAYPPAAVRGKYGDPTTWDGLTSMFVYFAKRSTKPLTPTEKAWLRILESRLEARGSAIARSTEG